MELRIHICSQGAIWSQRPPRPCKWPIRTTENLYQHSAETRRHSIFTPLALTDDLEVAAWPLRRNRAKVDAAVTNAVPRNALGSYHLACLRDDRAAGWLVALLANIGPLLLLPSPHFDVLSSRHLLFPSLELSLEHSGPSKQKGFASTLMPSSLPAASRLHCRCTPAVPETLHLASVNLLAWPAEYRRGGRLKDGLVVERCYISTGIGGDAAETPAIRSPPVGGRLKRPPCRTCTS